MKQRGRSEVSNKIDCGYRRHHDKCNLKKQQRALAKPKLLRQVNACMKAFHLHQNMQKKSRVADNVKVAVNHSQPQYTNAAGNEGAELCGRRC